MTVQCQAKFREGPLAIVQCSRRLRTPHTWIDGRSVCGQHFRKLEQNYIRQHGRKPDYGKTSMEKTAMATASAELHKQWEQGAIIVEYTAQQTGAFTVVTREGSPVKETAKWKTIGVARETVKEDQPLFNVYRYFQLGDDWQCSQDLSGASVHRMVDYLLTHPSDIRDQSRDRDALRREAHAANPMLAER